MDAVSSVGSASAAQVSQPTIAPGAAPAPAAGTGAATTSIIASSSSSITQLGGTGGFGGLSESLAKLAASGTPEDTMKMLVAMLLLEALLGKDKGDKEGKLGGMLALSMLGQAASSGIPGGMTMIENSSTLMVSQHGAAAAYSQTASASSLSVTG